MKGEATMSSDATPLKVEQCDREAAWRFIPACYTAQDKQDFMDGKYDKAVPLVRALAQHRLTSIDRLQSELTQAREDLERGRGALADVVQIADVLSGDVPLSIGAMAKLGSARATLSLLNTPAKEG